MAHEPPRSEGYGDTYYSAEDGWAESWHVFVAGNRLAKRFAALRTGEVFVVGELGFGTGLNVAAAMAAFAARGHARGHLAVFSVEGHPLSRDAFGAHAASAGARWPEAAAVLGALAAGYPERPRGTVTLRPAPDVSVIVSFGEVSSVLAGAQLRADAWFLDGFSPCVNPAMWSEAVLGAVARLSRPDATFATFTVAGAVRRAAGAAGFEFAKAPGFGRKREMLTGVLRERPARAVRALGGEAVLDAPPGGPIAVLGGGIAGASVAWHLWRLGIAADLHDPRGAASGASGNPGGLVTPRLEAADTVTARFYRDAYAYALGFYAEAAPDAFERTGGVVRTGPGRAAKVLATGLWGEDALAAHPDGVFAPDAGVLRPGDAVRAMIGDVPVGGADAFEAGPDGFVVAGGRYASVVIAAPTLAATLDWGVPGGVLTGRRGQIDLFAGAPEGLVSGDGYAAPLGDAVMAGATYADASLTDEASPNAADTAINAATAARLTGKVPGAPLGARAAVRAATPDRHPMAGPVPDVPALPRTHAPLRDGGAPLTEPECRRGLFVLTGLGSRGLVTASILGAHVAALVAGAPSPLTSEAADGLHPARFAVRALRRKQA